MDKAQDRTSKASEMNVELARKIIADTQAALETVAAKYGLEVRAGGGKYDSIEGTLSPKVEYRIVSSDQERKTFVANAPLFGMKPEHYGARFTYKRTAYTLIGFAVGRSRFTVKGRDADGKTMLFTDSILDTVYPERDDFYRAVSRERVTAAR